MRGAISTLVQRFKEITGPFRLLCARALSNYDRRMAAAALQDVTRLTATTRILNAELSRRLCNDVESEANRLDDGSHGVATPGWTSDAETNDLLDNLSGSQGMENHQEVIKLCESAINGEETPEVHFALARSHFALASGGNELHAWPALLAALDGIQKRCGQIPEVSSAVGICQWVLDLFADTHRIDIHRFCHRSPDRVGRRDGPTDPGAHEGLPMCDLNRIEIPHERRDQVKLGNALLAAAPPVMRYARSEEWVAREARYLSANLLSMVAQDKSVAVEPLAGNDFPMPGGHEAQLYAGYLFTAARTRRQQLVARGRGVPSILIAAMPKSASEFLCYTLAEILGAAIARTTIGDPFQGVVYAKWAQEAVQGGCVTHDHFKATEANLAALRAANVERITVLVRDPRSAAWSLLTMASEWDGPPPESRLDSLMGGVKHFAAWIASWIGAQKAGFPVTFVRFKDLTTAPAAVMADVLRAHGAAGFIPHLRDTLRRRKRQKRLSSNFRQGNNDAWRAHVPSDMQAALWDLIPVQVKDLLDLGA